MSKWSIAVPVGKTSLSQFWAGFINFIANGKTNLNIAINISNRVDLNRSQAIQGALKSKSHLIMVDSDVIPLISKDKVIEIAEEHFKNGYGMVIAPVIQSTGQLVVNPLPKSKSDIYWDIVSGSFSLVAISYEAMHKLKYIDIYDTHGNEPAKMYTIYTAKQSEDIYLCNKLIENGDKIVCDSRIKVAHLQTVPLDWKQWGLYNNLKD